MRQHLTLKRDFEDGVTRENAAPRPFIKAQLPSRASTVFLAAALRLLAFMAMDKRVYRLFPSPDGLGALG